MSNPSRIEHFPITYFATVMGLAGLTLAWQKANGLWQLDLPISATLLPVSVAVFAVLLALYAVKGLRYPAAVLAEWRNPVKLSFFPAVSISLLLLATVLLPVSAVAGETLWWAGSGLHLLLTLTVVNTWLHHEHFEVTHINPAWFIPAVGNVLVPLAGVPLGQLELSWFFFSIGMLFWVILLVIIFNRVMFHHPLPDKLMPTLFILIAPPAVGFIAYLKLAGDLDAFARMLYFSGLFLTLLLLSQVVRFSRLRFFLSWWAYSFPLAAISIASMAMYETSAVTGYAYVAALLLALLSAVVLMLVLRTALEVWRRGVCVPEA